MAYDFTSIMERQGMDVIAVDGFGLGGAAPDASAEGFDAIPMWVADMSFPTAPSITRAMAKRIERPAFGYFSPRDECHQAIIDWRRRHNGVGGLEPGHMGYESGVLGGVVSTLTAFAAPGDAVLLHSPTYIGFTHCIEENGYRIVLSSLVQDERGVWRMDFDDMAAKLEENHIHVAVLCSPHDPCGRVWERWEIERAMGVYREHDCVVTSDEIWSDLVLPGHHHVPTQSVSDDARRRTVALYARARPSTWQGSWGAITSSTTITCATAWRPRVQNATTTR